jgi:hypothetical protein
MVVVDGSRTSWHCACSGGWGCAKIAPGRGKSWLADQVQAADPNFQSKYWAMELRDSGQVALQKSLTL